MFRRLEPPLQLRQRGGQVPFKQRVDGEAKAREDAASDHSRAIDRQWAVFVVQELEPVEPVFSGTPDDVLLHAVSPIDAALGVHVDRCAACGDLDDQLRRTLEIVVVAQVVAREPFVLVGRTPNPEFRFGDLVGPRIAVAVDVPTPWMTLFDDLDRAGLWPRTPALPAAAFVRLKAALFAGGLIMYDVPYAHAVDEELSSTGVADGG